jgi:hypothetical protein
MARLRRGSTMARDAVSATAAMDRATAMVIEIRRKETWSWRAMLRGGEADEGISRHPTAAPAGGGRGTVPIEYGADRACVALSVRVHLP